MFGMNPRTGDMASVGDVAKMLPPAIPHTDKVSPRFGDGQSILKRGRVVMFDPELADDQIRTDN